MALKRYSYEGNSTFKVWASRASVVGIVTGLRAGLSRVRISVVFRDSCLDIAGTVYHLVIYMQSNKIHRVFLMSEFIQHLC